jgi:outer membrane lipoprotein-sorting protein
MTLRTVLAVLFASFTWAASQASPQTILQATSEAVQDIRDASLTLQGTLTGPDGSLTEVDAEVLARTEPQAVSVYVYAPAALADNILAFDEDTLYDYAFITNQLTLSDLDDPDALGGPFGGFDPQMLTQTLDVGDALSAWEGEVLAQGVETPRGPATRLAFTNPESGADVARVEVEIVDADRLPYRIVFRPQDGGMLGELRLLNLEINQGLTRDDVLAFPPDAQVIDERSTQP